MNHGRAARPATRWDDDEFAAMAREWGRRTRVQQGLPPQVTDPATIQRVLVLLGRDRAGRGRTRG